MNKILIGLVVSVLIPLKGCWASNAGIDSDAGKVASSDAFQSDSVSEGRHYKLVKGQEVLIDGKVYPVCKDLLRNLNSFPDAPPMVCERKYNPEMGFTTPGWKPIPKNEIDWEILRQIYFSKNEKRFSEEGLEKEWPEERARLEALAEERTILWHAEFDIDNKNGKENVLMLRANNCSRDEHYSSYIAPDPTLHVLDKTGKRLDKKYERLDRTSFEVFRYENHTYLAKWRGTQIEHSGAQLFIHDAFMPRNRFGFSNKPICTYGYIK